jgi:hypothetical protein
MAKISIPLFCLFLLAGQSRADEWTGKDTAWEATYLLLHVADWGQTLYIARHPDQYYEVNPILGKHPSRGRVNTYFALTGLVHVAGAVLLPTKFELFNVKFNPRRAWQFSGIYVEAFVVQHNYRVGIKFYF